MWFGQSKFILNEVYTHTATCKDKHTYTHAIIYSNTWETFVAQPTRFATKGGANLKDVGSKGIIEYEINHIHLKK